MTGMTGANLIAGRSTPRRCSKLVNDPNLSRCPGLNRHSTLEPVAVALYQFFQVKLTLHTFALVKAEIDLTQLTAVMASNL
jgi:hypothetical protein